MENLKIQNQNFFYADKFQFVLNRTPKLNYNCTAIKFPDLSTDPQKMNTPNNAFFVSGKKLEFGKFEITFLVDEDLENYLEVYKWLLGTTSAIEFQNYNDLINDERYTPSMSSKIGEHKIYSDATLVTLTNVFNVNLAYTFVNVFPTAVSGPIFNFEEEEAPVLCRAEFQYDYFKIEKIT